MSYPYPLGFAHSPASFDFARSLGASSGQLDHTDLGPGPLHERDGVLNWIRRNERHCVARSRHGGLLRIGAEDENCHSAAGTLFLSHLCDDEPSEVLGQGTEEELKLLADRFEASPGLFRMVRHVSQIMPNRAA